MPETPQQWYARVNAAIESDGYRQSDLAQWSSWPWTGSLTPKPLDPPADEEPPRRGVGGVGCSACDHGSAGDEEAAEHLIWREELWMVALPFEPSSLPFAAFLMPRRHADLQDLTPAESARQGQLLTAVERAACAVLDIPRIQVARWGDGSEHLHWWLYARPTGQLQLRGTFLSHWGDLLPPRDAAEARADGEVFAAELAATMGGQALSRNSSAG